MADKTEEKVRQSAGPFAVKKPGENSRSQLVDKLVDKMGDKLYGRKRNMKNCNYRVRDPKQQRQVQMKRTACNTIRKDGE